MYDKIVTADQAMALVGSGDTVFVSGFVGTGTPEALIRGLERAYLERQAPNDLTLVFAAAPGDGRDRGLNRLAHDGLVRRAIGGHWALVPKLGQRALDGAIEAYNLPLGVISHLVHDIAANKAGTVSKVGLHTFVDPRLDGGRLNDATSEELVSLEEIDGDEWLFYRAFPIDVALIRGTTADPAGNITMEREALTLDTLSVAMAAKNSKGLVIAQVEQIAAHGALRPKEVVVPGIMVDCVVVAEPEDHRQTYATGYNRALSGELRVPLEGLAPLPLDARKVIARRCAFELPMNGVVNLGIGMPEGVAQVAAEEKILDFLTLTAEPGVIGGLPQGGLDFGAAINPDAIIQQSQQFEFYDGGGLDLACLGMAQVDGSGHVNVSRFGGRLAGAGGFINISQNARRLVFAGTFTSGGLEVGCDDGHLRIHSEGRVRKFIDAVEQITFNGSFAAEREQPVLYVTERCVFELTVDGLELVEVAPGIDIERDIVAQMGFRPLIRELRSMDPRIFAPAPMGLSDTLLGMTLEERLSYDVDRNLLFANFEGLMVATEADVAAIRDAIEQRCRALGQRVGLVVNYDGCVIAPALTDAYADMVQYMQARYYTTATRYTTSAFMRHKLRGALSRRDLAPHVFETRQEARALLAGPTSDR